MAEVEPKYFFKQQRETAEIKAEILPRFFLSWSGAVLANQEPRLNPSILYLDLTAGQATAASAQQPVSFDVLKKIYISTGARYDLNAHVQTFLYDGKRANASFLQTEIAGLPFYEELQQKPLFLFTPEGKASLQETWHSQNAMFLAVDPFGNEYGRQVWLQALEKEHADFLMLFEARKMVSALKNVSEGTAFSAFLGDRVARIREFFLQHKQAGKREKFVLNCFSERIQEEGYHLSRFKVNVPGKDQASHYLLFVSKAENVHARFKELLLEYSDYQEDGVPLLGANLKPFRPILPEYFKYLEYSMVNLVEDLSRSGNLYGSMSLEKIYERHGVGKPYSKENYKTAVEKLKEQGKVIYLNPKTGQMVYKLAYGCRIKYKA